MIVGPILKRSGGYAFDIWTAAKGVSRGCSYRRIEDAYYDRKVTLETFRRPPAPTVTVCETFDSFQDAIHGWDCRELLGGVISEANRIREFHHHDLGAP
jgi:hypothetical protein